MPRFALPLNCVALGLVMLAACGPSHKQTGSSTILDSSGIRIVQNRQPSGNVAYPWRVDSTPVLSIGVEEGSESYQFYGVSSVAELHPGTLAVADRSRTIRLFDSTGHLLNSIGREGDGPGEFRQISLMVPFGDDSLLIWDFAARRVTIMSRNGHGAHIERGPSITGFYFPVGVFQDGSILGQLSPPLDMRRATPGLLPTKDIFLRFDWRSGIGDTLVEATSTTSYIREDRAEVVSIPFAAGPITAVRDSSLYFCAGTTYEVRKFSQSGRLLQVARLDRAAEPLTQTMIAAKIRQIVESSGNNREGEVSRRFSGLPYPETLPTCARLIVDAHGNVWFGHYEADGDEPTTWTIFDPQGRFLGDVSTPKSFEVFAIDSSSIVGVSRDGVGVERVEVLRLHANQ